MTLVYQHLTSLSNPLDVSLKLSWDAVHASTGIKSFKRYLLHTCVNPPAHTEYILRHHLLACQHSVKTSALRWGLFCKTLSAFSPGKLALQDCNPAAMIQHPNLPSKFIQKHWFSMFYASYTLQACQCNQYYVRTPHHGASCPVQGTT